MNKESRNSGIQENLLLVSFLPDFLINLPAEGGIHPIDRVDDLTLGASCATPIVC